MKEIKSKYPFDLLTAIGMQTSMALEPENVSAEAARIRAAYAYWRKRTGTSNQIKITTQFTPVGMITLERIEDKKPDIVPSDRYEKSEKDRLGDSHRKYDFSRLPNVGDKFQMLSENPILDRQYAHVAGKAWCKRRNLNWRFKVRISPNRLMISIERVK